MPGTWALTCRTTRCHGGRRMGGDTRDVDGGHPRQRGARPHLVRVRRGIPACHDAGWRRYPAIPGDSYIWRRRRLKPQTVRTRQMTSA